MLQLWQCEVLVLRLDWPGAGPPTLWLIHWWAVSGTTRMLSWQPKPIATWQTSQGIKEMKWERSPPRVFFFFTRVIMWKALSAVGGCWRTTVALRKPLGYHRGAQQGRMWEAWKISFPFLISRLNYYSTYSTSKDPLTPPSPLPQHFIMGHIIRVSCRCVLYAVSSDRRLYIYI